MAVDGYFPRITLPSGSSDVRKGNGIAFIVNGKCMVVDAFEGSEATDNLIAWLGLAGVTEIELAIVTHAHGDHYGGFYDIVEAGIKIKEMRCYHPDSIRSGNSASREDSDNLLKLIRWLQARGTRVLFVDHGDVINFEDISWHVFRKQPTGPAASDDTNAWEYVNDGSLVLYSPELKGILFGDGPRNPKEAIAYFQQKFGAKSILIWIDISHHGGAFSRSNAESAREAGCVFAYESCVEKNGPGTTEWTAYGARRIKQQGIIVWMQDENIYIHAENGTISFTQGNKKLSYNIPYKGSIQEGWVKNQRGWWYKFSDGTWPIGWAYLKWSKGPSWFFFDEKGYMVTGWQHLNWSKGKNWFYFDTITGAMKTGWIFVDKCWYYLDPTTGAMRTGWVDWKGKKCYLEPVSGKNQGHCYINVTATIDGKTYIFDKGGYATEITDSKGELDGCDVASYQSGIEPANMTTTDFVIVKMTQGTWYVNPYADIQYSKAKNAGKLLAGYHYGEGGDPVKEAQFFVKKLGNRVGECALALDWEGKSNGKFNTTQEVEWVLKFANEVYRLTGVHIFLYMSKSVTRRRNWSDVAKDVRLWCAQYANNNPTNYQDTPWTDSNGWGAWAKDTIRQYSSKGRVRGYDKNLDINKAYLSNAEWLNHAGSKQETKTEETTTATTPKTEWPSYISQVTNPVKISNSGSDEHGNYKGGTAGDQTGKEWYIRDWYNRPWNCVLRHPLAEVRACIATLAVKAAENDKIGYDQSNRDSYGKELAKTGYNPSKITTAVESDCSKGVIDNTKAAGYILGIEELRKIEATYTGNMRAAYRKAGFLVLTGSRYLTGDDYLEAGDILLNDAHHTATVVTNGIKYNEPISMPLIKRGRTGDAVYQLQHMLNSVSYRNQKKLDEDGSFGPATQSQVIFYQMDRKLDPDGEVGDQTWGQLFEDVY